MTATNEQYFRFPRQLLESPAWSVLNIHERRAFDCIMREHQSKAGNVNDGLAVTRRDLVRGGLDPKQITNSMRVLRELGIIEMTRNMGGSVSGRTPNLWRPTFLPRTPTSYGATHDYLKITTREEAKAIAAGLRSHETRRQRPPPKTRKLQPAAPFRIQSKDCGATLMSKASRAREIKETDPNRSNKSIGRELDMDPSDVRRALNNGGGI